MHDSFSLHRGTPWPVSVAPMMDRSDRHDRFFVRCITEHSLLYTEMVTTGAILHGDRDRVLGFDPAEKPLALQLGGDDPAALAACARIAADWGYDEINLNVGCPSDRVQQGRFGACLMKEPDRVAALVAALRQAVPLPVTVKHRIGVDDCDRYEDMRHFVETVAAAGCDRFIVHARKAWLHGLSPKENREIPPLRHLEVHRLKRELPQLWIETNGGIRDLAQVRQHLSAVDGVMIGRAAYEDPYLLVTVDQEFYGAQTAPPTRREVILRLLPYVARWVERGLPLHRITRHVLGLFHQQPGARAWKRCLSGSAHRPGVSADLLLAAQSAIPDHVLDHRPSLAVSCSATSLRRPG